jgi:hypothetical protein
MAATPTLSNIQQELLKLYSSNIADADLLNIKQYLAKYFSMKAISEADSIWEQKGYTNDLMSEWLNQSKHSDHEGSH